MSLSSLNQAEITNIASILQEPAENFGNDPTVEMMWAVKAYEHAETYFNILLSVNPLFLNLCKIDAQIYKSFQEQFPDLKVDILIEEDIKSEDSKAKWRSFCGEFENQVVDWNMATLLRLDSSKDVSEDNTIIVPRIQFLAIEITRNKQGFNSNLKTVYSKKTSK